MGGLDQDPPHHCSWGQGWPGLSSLPLHLAHSSTTLPHNPLPRDTYWTHLRFNVGINFLWLCLPSTPFLPRGGWQAMFISTPFQRAITGGDGGEEGLPHTASPTAPLLSLLTASCSSKVTAWLGRRGAGGGQGCDFVSEHKEENKPFTRPQCVCVCARTAMGQSVRHTPCCFPAPTGQRTHRPLINVY